MRPRTYDFLARIPSKWKVEIRLQRIYLSLTEMFISMSPLLDLTLVPPFNLSRAEPIRKSMNFLRLSMCVSKIELVPVIQ
ncbi:MAG: hypothetical protein CTY22_09910 [Methylomonas sp.]|nr:MAG: hypothetical protein CTY22_09910 [Methylomonas sp.]PPD39813.1 MAG: hypothetical protein CTY17_07535 [Methylomonas sp.]PPD51367.1 MAG: hypothetical protein CTY11_12245 [Methylomonas sp.]